jgi:hypothetical protein
MKIDRDRYWLLDHDLRARFDAALDGAGLAAGLIPADSGVDVEPDGTARALVYSTDDDGRIRFDFSRRALAVEERAFTVPADLAADLAAAVAG